MVAGRAAGPYYRAPWRLGGLQGCWAILQGTSVAGRVAGPYYMRPGGWEVDTTGHCGSKEGCRAILQDTIVAGRTAGPY